MNEPAPVRTDDALDWLHEQGKQRAEAAPEFDVEETLFMVQVAGQLDTPEQELDSSADLHSPGAITPAIRSLRAIKLELACQLAADGRATVTVCGELDIETADQTYAYLRDVVDSQTGPTTLNLAEVTFCDAAGLGVLARVAGYAKQSGRSLGVTAVRPSLLRIMRITGMNEAFPEFGAF